MQQKYSKDACNYVKVNASSLSTSNSKFLLGNEAFKIFTIVKILELLLQFSCCITTSTN